MQGLIEVFFPFVRGRPLLRAFVWGFCVSFAGLIAAAVVVAYILVVGFVHPVVGVCMVVVGLCSLVGLISAFIAWGTGEGP